MRVNPMIAALFERIVERGKPAEPAGIACMAKLLTIVCGVQDVDRDLRGVGNEPWA